jgi:hypothetical protein
MRTFIIATVTTAAAALFSLPALTLQQDAASVPDLSGTWSHTTLGFELPLSGPGPVRNRSRRTGPQAGVGDGRQLVGDYTNPILQPWAAEVLKKFGEISLAGKGYPTPSQPVLARRGALRICKFWNCRCSSGRTGSLSFTPLIINSARCVCNPVHALESGLGAG